MTPDDVLIAYVEGWQDGDAQQVFANTQISYRTPRRIPPTRCRVVDVDQVSPVMVDVRAMMEFPGGEARLFTFRLIREDEAGDPSLDGTWGVNPASMRQYVPEDGH